MSVAEIESTIRSEAIAKTEFVVHICADDSIAADKEVARELLNKLGRIAIKPSLISITHLKR